MEHSQTSTPSLDPPSRSEPSSTTGVVDEFSAWEEASRVQAKLALKSGETWQGFSFGAPKSVAGEVVFSTGMVGYTEALTDPSFMGQILVLTFPLVGNYGVPNDDVDEHGLPKYFEGARIFPAAVVVAEYSFTMSHFQAHRTLSAWLVEQGVPGIFGVDTRSITKLLRSRGSTLGAVVMGPDFKVPNWVDPNERNLVAEVSITSPKDFDPAKIPDIKCAEIGSGENRRPVKIIAVDCGIKYNIIRFLVRYLGVHLKVVPWNYDFTNEEFDGLFLSNGPGDPQKCQETINAIHRIMEQRPTLPIFGICLGHQLLALAAGAKTYKMPFGNRGMNQPCIDLRSGRCYITAQNHGFAVDDDTLPKGWTPLFTNANDGSNEGIAHIERPWVSVQFHPEACGGPVDTSFLFDEFLRLVVSSQPRLLTTIKYRHPRNVAKVLVLGSGGLTIGQAGEFDYSGSQAIKALREQHIQSILINPNIATVQTSKGLSDQIFFVPVTPEFVTKVIEKVRPDGLFAAFGGQTALNCAIALHKDGTLKKYGVQVLGTQIDAIIATEDRELFKSGVESLDEKVAESSCAATIEEARKAASRIGYPVLVRAAYALGGLGSGFAGSETELDALCQKAFVNSPQVIIDECLKGWKELEYEVMRDAKDNCLVVCNMENLDPMGIHTGDSVVVAPSQTLCNEEYHKLRETAIKVIRHFGIVGEANIQYALDPKSRRYRIVEVNARLSRSSALASKATGYPLAYIAAKIALGYDLITLRNQVTRSTTACFEPALDYCVIKVPRWDTDKFPTVDKTLGTQMKSVGEVMSIGRSFTEAIQKAMRMVDDRSLGFDSDRYLWSNSVRPGSSETVDAATTDEALRTPGPLRLWALAHAFKLGHTPDSIHKLTSIDLWFLSKLFAIHSLRTRLEKAGGIDYLSQAGRGFLLRCKQLGFSDKQISIAVGKGCNVQDVTCLRDQWDIHPCIKQVDTLAAEFPAQTNYLYLTYVGTDNDVLPLHSDDLPAYKDALYDTAFGKGSLLESTSFHAAKTSLDRQTSTGASPTCSPKLGPSAVSLDLEEEPLNTKPTYVVLGSGCYRIGASVEFDWSCVSAVRTIREAALRAIVINCNPETVSTDYDESDRLYFEELTLETVLEICRFEMPRGVVVSVGGQTPNNLVPLLDKHGIPILGTPAAAIDMAEDRSKFSQLCDRLGVDQPRWSQFVDLKDALKFAHEVEFPVLVRPSYVLSGAAMRVIDDEDQLRSFLQNASVVQQEYPVVISKYISGAREIEFDAIGRNGEILNYAISEHVEDAGTHSGDATLLLPAQTLHFETHRRVRQVASQLCRALSISGPFNIQFLAQEGGSSSSRSVKVIECNVRASRTVPYISKTFNVNFIELATKVMLGYPVDPVNIPLAEFDFTSCKVPMFSFLRLNGADPHVGVEMQSTGEVACFGRTANEAFLKAMIAGGLKLPKGPCGVLLSLGSKADKEAFLPYVGLLAEMGHTIYATAGTAEFINSSKTSRKQPIVIVVKQLPNAISQKEPNVSSAIRDGHIQMVVNTPSSRDSSGATAGYYLRRRALDAGVAVVVELRQAIFLVDALHQKWLVEREGGEFWSMNSWHDCHRIG